MKCLFHGSSTQGLRYLKPNISLELKKRVYASEDFIYALVRSGRQLDLIREEYEGMDRGFTLAECYPDAFEKTFECPGSVYLVGEKFFRLNPDDPDEFISEYGVPVYCELPFDNVWNVMQRLEDHFEFVYYGTDEWYEYWSKVRGGLDGYLHRKLTRKEKMMEMRAK